MLIEEPPGYPWLQPWRGRERAAPPTAYRKYRPEAPLRADTPIIQMRAEQGRWEGVAGERAVAAYNTRSGGVPWHMLSRVRQRTAVERPDAQARPVGHNACSGGSAWRRKVW